MPPQEKEEIAVSGQTPSPDQLLTWAEIRSHNKKDDLWLVIDGQVYDVTRWSKRHPGGAKILHHYAGQDASEAWLSFHNDKKLVRKYMQPLCIGKTDGGLQEEDQIKKDFRELRETVDKMGLFKPSYTFFGVVLAQAVLLYVLAYLIITHCGSGWVPVLFAGFVLSIAQIQAGWLQHDFGHLSVFKTKWMDTLAHHVVIGLLKGASSGWWKNMHYQHHAKPNVVRLTLHYMATPSMDDVRARIDFRLFQLGKDPDVRLEPVFVVGNVMPVQVAKKHQKSAPYNWQHVYFMFLTVGLIPFIFHFTIYRFLFTRQKWHELVFALAFNAMFIGAFYPHVGLTKTFVLWIVMRGIESEWFTWATQMSHIPMEIDTDKQLPWVPMQMQATCNVEKGHFNDWFTGHLNFQIEHHLFPTMPRHNLYKTTPLVKSLCKKHGLEYKLKTLGEAFGDVLRSLKKSGEIWEETYSQTWLKD